MNVINSAEARFMAQDDLFEIKFGKLGNINSFANAGFDLTDGDNSSWTEQQSAYIDFAPRWPARDLSLSLSAIPFLVPDRISHQQIFIHVNGLFCGLHNLFESRQCQFQIPRNAVSNRSTRIMITIPTAISPKHLGISEDVRTLGIAIVTLALTPT